MTAVGKKDNHGAGFGMTSLVGASSESRAVALLLATRDFLRAPKFRRWAGCKAENRALIRRDAYSYRRIPLTETLYKKLMDKPKLRL